MPNADKLAVIKKLIVSSCSSLPSWQRHLNASNALLRLPLSHHHRHQLCGESEVAEKNWQTTTRRTPSKQTAGLYSSGRRFQYAAPTVSTHPRRGTVPSTLLLGSSGAKENSEWVTTADKERGKLCDNRVRWGAKGKK